MGLYPSHLGVPLDVVMRGVSVLNQGRVLCTRGSEQDCWHTALPEPVVLGGPGMVFLGGLGVTHSVPPGHRHLQSATCKSFQHVKVDTLSQPEAISSVAVPGRRAATPGGGGQGPLGSQHLSSFWGARVGRWHGVKDSTG